MREPLHGERCHRPCVDGMFGLNLERVKPSLPSEFIARSFEGTLGDRFQPAVTAVAILQVVRDSLCLQP